MSLQVNVERRESSERDVAPDDAPGAEYAAVRHILASPTIAGRTAPYIGGDDFDWGGLLVEAETFSGGESLLVRIAWTSGRPKASSGCGRSRSGSGARTSSACSRRSSSAATTGLPASRPSFARPPESTAIRPTSQKPGLWTTYQPSSALA